MANFLIPAVGDDISETNRGIQLAIQAAAQNGCELVLLVPGIKNAQESNMLEQILGSNNLATLAKKRQSVNIAGVKVRIEALSTFKGAALNTFKGIILGLWTSKQDATTISGNAISAQDIILIQWIEDELKAWAQNNNATII
ncbi:hypothetical protein [Enterobacter hormaechei]|jgi:hypothetical protein|uniref:hypothetical protein n=1 Tax=Enterobacter hormaechei TaxID=158836 RepID=UPI00197CBC84|nr:hypothetical protein [Enterobacter hormaechei]MBN4787725.1 hypothetical protein [Enterobacter hormaechei]